MHNITLSALGKAAIAYATRGFAVFPCVPRGKVPATRHGCRDATKDLARITAWWCENPNYNVAVATGPVSKVFVLDVDGIDAEASLRKLEAQHGALPETGKASRRAAATSFSDAKMAWSGTVRARLLPVSISEVTAAMSYCRRQFIQAGALMCGASTAGTILPKRRLGLPTRSAAAITELRRKAKSPEHWHHIITNTVSNGARNSTLTSICGKLLHTGVTELALLYDVMCCINLARCRGATI